MQALGIPAQSLQILGQEVVLQIDGSLSSLGRQCGIRPLAAPRTGQMSAVRITKIWPDVLVRLMVQRLNPTELEFLQTANDVASVRAGNEPRRILVLLAKATIQVGTCAKLLATDRGIDVVSSGIVVRRLAHGSLSHGTVVGTVGLRYGSSPGGHSGPDSSAYATGLLDKGGAIVGQPTSTATARGDQCSAVEGGRSDWSGQGLRVARRARKNDDLRSARIGRWTSRRRCRKIEVARIVLDRISATWQGFVGFLEIREPSGEGSLILPSLGVFWIHLVQLFAFGLGYAADDEAEAAHRHHGVKPERAVQAHTLKFNISYSVLEFAFVMNCYENQ